jgi:hypothetical protein
VDEQQMAVQPAFFTRIHLHDDDPYRAHPVLWAAARPYSHHHYETGAWDLSVPLALHRQGEFEPSREV